MPFARVRRANPLIHLGLVLSACRADHAEMGPPPAAILRATPTQADFEIYARGTGTEIRLLRGSLTAGGEVTRLAVDSAAALATGLPVEGYRAVSGRVESWLRDRPTATAQVERLDSLRLELMVLRVRVEAQP